jgi:hypothetical protein
MTGMHEKYAEAERLVPAATRAHGFDDMADDGLDERSV